MNPYCRRAVGKAVELAMERAGARVTVMTLGPPAADDTLREAIAWGLDCGVDIDGVHVTDEAFAGSDTLATAKALAAALTSEGPFDLVLAGRNSVDADTGQVGPELAELLGLPFLTGVRHLAVDGTRVDARCEHDDGWMQAEVALPAVLSCAERLCEPAKVDLAGRAAVPAALIRRVAAADLGPGPWGADASPTSVGPVKVMAVRRARIAHPDAPVAEQVRDAVQILRERGALRPASEALLDTVPARRDGARGPAVAVVAEPDRAHATARVARRGSAARRRDRRTRGRAQRGSPEARGARRVGRRRHRAPRPPERRGGRRDRGCPLGPTVRAMGDPHRLHRVGSRGRVPRRGAAGRRPHR